MFPNLITPEYEDKIFLLASELILDKNNKSWKIVLQPGNELVVLNNSISDEIPTIKDVRNSIIDINDDYNQTHYKGHILFSGGVILIINDKFVMLQRDNDAPVDPGKWTCPAGRCSDMPHITSLKEFYEELAVFESQNAIFLKTNKSTSIDMEIYKQTIARKKEIFLPIKEIPCSIDNNFDNCNVSITRGTETFDCGSLWSWFDKGNNTLELRVVVKTSVDDSTFNKLVFEDGELFNRKVSLFSTEELCGLPLVPAMEQFLSDISKSNKNP